MNTYFRLTVAFVSILLLHCNVNVAHSQQLISSEFKRSISQEELNAQFQLPFAQNGIRLYKLRYTMPDLKGVTDTVSGLLIVPDRTGVTLPLLCAMHGTVDSKTDVPSNLMGGYELGGVFGALGYVTFMPDFLGLGDSRGLHPYVHAASEAASGINMLFAVRQYAAQNRLLLNDQLFLTGYSQGGHAAMAMHQAIERNYATTLKVTAAAHLAGPYSISQVMLNTILSDQEYQFPAYHAYTFLSYNLAYGFYQNIESVFKPAYAAEIRKFLAGTLTVSGLNVSLKSILTREHGRSVAKFMLQDSIITILSTNSNHRIRQALRDNDTYNWRTLTPTRLVYCRADDQVPFRNSIVADSVMSLLGGVNVEAIDVNPNADHTGCVLPAVLNTITFFNQFQRIQTNTKDLSTSSLSIEVYPNPAQEIVVFKNAPDDALLQIMDVTGKRVWSKKLSGSNQANLNNLAKGVYIAKISSGQGQWTGRIVLK
jgi:hypothetical protein